MFLFNKKTRNIIKYIWIVLTVLIVLSMILVYSGFSSLAQTPATQSQQMDIPPEVQAQLQAQKDGQPIDMGSSPEKEAVLKAIEEGRLNIDPSATGTQTQTPPTDETTPATPTAPPLKLEI